MQGPGIDLVDHPQRLGVGFFLNVDRGVEVAARLQVIEQVPLALVQQVVIHRVLFVDGTSFFKTPRLMW